MVSGEVILPPVDRDENVSEDDSPQHRHSLTRIISTIPVTVKVYADAKPDVLKLELPVTKQETTRKPFYCCGLQIEEFSEAIVRAADVHETGNARSNQPYRKRDRLRAELASLAVCCVSPPGSSADGECLRISTG